MVVLALWRWLVLIALGLFDGVTPDARLGELQDAEDVPDSVQRRPPGGRAEPDPCVLWLRPALLRAVAAWPWPGTSRRDVLASTPVRIVWPCLRLRPRRPLTVSDDAAGRMWRPGSSRTAAGCASKRRAS